MSNLTITSSELSHLKEQKRAEKIASLKYSAPNGFWEFCKYLYPNFFNDAQTERVRYAKILNNCGVWTLTGDPKFKKYRKVMVNIFPRFAKSFMLSIWSVWLLWQFPRGSIMRNAHDATLAEKFSRDVRNMIETTNDIDNGESSLLSVPAKIHAIAPKLKLSQDKRALNMWALTQAKDVSYFCAGVRGSVTGNGCDLAMILDDPVKDPEKALSPTFNEDLLTWYLTVHRSRQDRDSKAFGCEVIVMARWSDKDLCASLLESEADWYVVNFDIEDESGNSACESIISTEKVREMKQGFLNTGRLMWWNALYRQQVSDISKRLFPRTKLRRFDPTDYNFKDTRRYLPIAYCDMADEGTDSLSMPFGYLDLSTGDVYVTDCIFSREESHITRGVCAERILRNNSAVVAFESNNGGKYFGELVGQEIDRISQEIYVSSGKIIPEQNFEYVRTQSNKETKILVYSSVVLSKVLFIEDALLDGGSDYYLFLRELCGYEKERKNLHDDAPDSICSLAKRFCAGSGFEIF